MICVDEKLSIQAVERAQGYLKFPNGRALSGQSHDYKRHGTSTLFAALEVATGKVMTCKILDLRFQAVPDEITPCHSSLGGEFGEGIDVVKDAQHRLRRRERSSRP